MLGNMKCVSNIHSQINPLWPRGRNELCVCQVSMQFSADTMTVSLYFAWSPKSNLFCCVGIIIGQRFVVLWVCGHYVKHPNIFLGMWIMFVIIFSWESNWIAVSSHFILFSLTLCSCQPFSVYPNLMSSELHIYSTNHHFQSKSCGIGSYEQFFKSVRNIPI